MLYCGAGKCFALPRNAFPPLRAMPTFAMEKYMKIENNASTRALLDAVQRARLEMLAPHFGFSFERVSAQCFALRDEVLGYEECLKMEHAHPRLMVEIASRCAPWIYFHFNEPCHRTLLKLTDERLLRIAELYAKSRAVA